MASLTVHICNVHVHSLSNIVKHLYNNTDTKGTELKDDNATGLVDAVHSENLVHVSCTNKELKYFL